MNKSSKRWKVFVLVLCLLFTMTPATVFADDQAGAQQNVVVDQTGGQSTPLDPGATTPPNPEPPAPPVPEPPAPPVPEKATVPAIDTTSPPAFQMLNTVVETACNGTIEITKVINNDPGTNDIFSFKISKWTEGKHGKWYWSPVRTVTKAGEGVVTVDGLIGGEYKVEEIDIPDNYVVDDSETDKFTVGSDVVPVTFTNTFTTGTITIVKTIKDGIPELQDTFTFKISKKSDAGRYEPFKEVKRDGAGTIIVDNLLNGDYKIEEIQLPDDDYEIEGRDGNIQFAKISNSDFTDDVKFTNKYTAGTIKINKIVLGNPPSPETFTFDIYEGKLHGNHWVGDNKPDYTVSIVGGGLLVVSGLEDGDYKIVERDIENEYYDMDESKPVVSIGYWFGHHKSVEFKNTYNGPTTGSLKIIKNVSVEEDIAIPETVFDFTVSGPDYLKTVSITGGAFVILDDLAPGEYKVTEAYAEDFYPEENDYDKVKTVIIGETATAEFTNYYDPEEPTISVTKEVALYNGVIPESGFGKSLTLTELNKQVIYRVSYSYNDAWERSNRDVDLTDSYDRNGSISDITLHLKYWFEGELVTPDGFDPNEVYYYIDTLPTNGTYTNTANLEEQEGVIASSSAVVVVNYTPPNNNNGGGGGGGSHHYDVTYNANYPTGSGISGIVPKDTNGYSYNSKVTVRENTGDLKAGTYTFIGWNTKADGTGTMYLPGSTFNITADTILYAQWKLESEPAAAVVDPSAGTDGGGTVAAETVQAAGLDDVPKTGTGAPLIPMFLLGLFSLAGITICRKKVFD